MTKRRAPRKSHEERTAEIVETAVSLAAEDGPKNVTTQSIADRIGVAQATVFRHFPTRDAIFRAAMEWIAGGLFKVLEGLFDGDAPADERLKRLLLRQVAFISRRRGMPRLLFSDQLHRDDPELKATVRRIMERYAGRLAALLAEGVESGVFRADLDPERTAWMVMALIQGTVMRWSIYDFEFPLEEEGEKIWEAVWAVVRPE